MRSHRGRPLAWPPYRAALTLLIPLMATSAASARQAKSPPLQATLEMVAPFTHEGDPLLVRVAVFNTGEQPYDNAAGIDLLGGLKLAGTSGSKPALKDKPQADPKRQPAVIAPGGFFGVILDLSPLVPDLSRAGTYTLSWEAAGLAAAPLTLKVLPKFDPSASYVAVIETDYGYLEFDLKTKQAPKHVQNFHDLSLIGFYDNTPIHQVMKGVEIRGGDPAGTGAGWPGYSLDPEVTEGARHGRGTLSSVKLPGQNQDNGSQFVITLSAHEAYDGALSIFGALRKGEEVLQAIENIPTTGMRDQPPYFRPIKPIVIRSVTVKKAAEASRGSGR